MLVFLPPCCVAQNGHPVWGAFQGTQNPAPDHGLYYKDNPYGQSGGSILLKLKFV